jgi:hypothetical protein
MLNHSFEVKMIIKQKTRKIFAVGGELGNRADGTAVSVVELVDTDPASDQPRLQVRHLKRFPPGTPFKDIADGLLDVLNSKELSQSKDVDVTVLIVIDQTAVGSSVVDEILKTLNRPDARRVFMFGSHTESYSNGINFVPKQELISCLQAGLGWELLKFAEALSETKALVEELVNYQDRKTNTILQADTWREHKSDDLVFAVALACWMLQQDTRFSYEFL